mgnify:CR=1 FL=1
MILFRFLNSWSFLFFSLKESDFFLCVFCQRCHYRFEGRIVQGSIETSFFTRILPRRGWRFLLKRLAAPNLFISRTRNELRPRIGMITRESRPHERGGLMKKIEEKLYDRDVNFIFKRKKAKNKPCPLVKIKISHCIKLNKSFTVYFQSRE